MAHVAFFVLHAVALIFFAAALLVTVPLHLIYSAMTRRSSGASARCPACMGAVHPEATICAHCRQALTPESVRFAQQRADRIAAGKRFWQS